MSTTSSPSSRKQRSSNRRRQRSHHYRAWKVVCLFTVSVYGLFQLVTHDQIVALEERVLTRPDLFLASASTRNSGGSTRSSGKRREQQQQQQQQQVVAYSLETTQQVQKRIQSYIGSDHAFEQCAWLATRSDAENRRIQEKCETSGKLVVYNPLPRERYLCDGIIIQADSVLTLDQNDCKAKGSNEPIATLFPVTPQVNAKGMPPVVLRFGKQRHTGGGELFPGCDVDCESHGAPAIVTTRTVQAADGSEWSLTFSMEGPKYYPNLNIQPDAYQQNRFYSTTSFESDVPLPYYSRAEYNIQTPPLDYDKAIKGAVFLARNCHSKNHRERLIEKLQKTDFRVDSLSSCLHNAEPPAGVDMSKKDEILQHYLFYLAFENQNVDDYITEKLWGPFQAGTVPIYYGAPNAKLHAPNHSMIHVDDFQGDTQALADYLTKVANDKELYQSYQAWRSQPLPEHFVRRYNITDVHSTCRTCRWAYARMYGLGWNHTTQRVQELRAGPRSVCLDKSGVVEGGGLVRQPFVESYDLVDGGDATSAATADQAVSESCNKLRNDNRVSLIANGRVRRTVRDQDGVVDLLIEQVDDGVPPGGDTLTLQVKTPLTHPGAVATRRQGAWSLQDEQSRFTVLAFPLDGVSVKVSGPDGVILAVAVSAFPLRLRIIVEDVDTFHKGAEEAENAFGKLMADDFLRPLERFVQV